MSQSWDIVVVGSCMIDLVCYAPRLPNSGETIRGTSFKTGLGGKGCNQCVAVKKLGGNCVLVARIGSDTYGKIYYEKLDEYGIPRNFVKITEGTSTGMAQITVAETGENQIVIVPGANDRLTEEDVNEATSAIIDCKVLVCQLEIPEEVTIKALKIKSTGGQGKSILNAAPARENLNPSLFLLPDIFCVNETEAETVLGKKVNGLGGAKNAVTELLGRGCREVIVTLGEMGTVYGKQGSEDVIYIPAFPVKAVDTTGAGDAFVGALAFLLAVHPEMKVAEILKKANAVAALSVQRLGTQESFPSLDEVPKEYGIF